MAQSTLRLSAFLFFLFGSSFFLSSHFLGRTAVLWSFVVLLSVSALIYFYGDQWLLRRLSGRKYLGQDPWGINGWLAEISSKARVEPPHFVVIDEETPQAFVLGMRPSTRSIVFTTGLLHHLSQEEIRAVIADLIASFRYKFAPSLVLLTIAAKALMKAAAACDTLAQVLTGLSKERRTFTSHPMTFFVSPILWTLSKWLAPFDYYYQMDEWSSQLTNKPRELAQALWKIESYTRTKPMVQGEPLYPLLMVNPVQAAPWKRFLNVQPPVEFRIKKLLGYYPV